jgi:hypothetical protein
LKICVQIYTNVSPEIALRRLLLENVLLLASRRVPFSLASNTSHAHYGDIRSPEAFKVVRETCGKALQNIFNYYVHMCETRRNQIAASELMRRNNKEALRPNAVIPAPGSSAGAGTGIGGASGEAHDGGSTTSSASASASSKSRDHRDLITYKEYIQFCHDFSLRSTVLLTAIQVGEVYLNCVPLDSVTRSLKGMNFDTFCLSIVYMAAIAYRELDCAEVPMHNKVKALLLFMWKHVNNREKIAEVARSRVRVLISNAGSLNLYGSVLFSYSFILLWQSEGFQTYTEPPKTTQREKGTVSYTLSVVVYRISTD